MADADDNTKKSMLCLCKVLLKNIFYTYMHFGTLNTYKREFFIEKLLEPKRMKVSPLKIQYQK